MFTEKVNGQKDAAGKTVGMDSKTPEIAFEVLTQKELYRLMRMKGLPITHGMTNAQMVAALKIEAAESTRKANEKAAAEAAAKNEPAPDPKKVPETSNVGMTTYPDKPGLTQEAMPYLQGIEANMVNPQHRWIIAAVEADMPLKAGISGTTHRFMGLGELLGVGDKEGMRLAMLGHLQAIEAHSFWEIVDASLMGNPPRGKYVPFKPVENDDMEKAALETVTNNPDAEVDGKKDVAILTKLVVGLPIEG